ncbi:hypothetical protein XANCAGTX0491_007669 [Xanthoria calcicola]
MFPPIAFWLSIATWMTTIFASPIDLSLAPKNLLLPRAPSRPTLTGAPVPIGLGTYPRATRLRDGTIVAVYTAFQSGSNILLTARSTNNGATFTPLGEITRGASNANDIDNAYLLQLPSPSTRIICAFRNHSKDPVTGIYTFFRITITASDDGGKTWRYLSQPASDPGPVTGNWEPYLRTTSDGTNALQLYYSRENNAQDQDTLQRTSHDGGLSWSPATCISGCGLTARDGMTSIANINSNSKSLILVYETSGATGLFSLGAVFSADDGRTWSGRRTIYTASSPNTSAGAPQVINVGGGTLVVSFMTNEDQRLQAPAGQYTENTAVKVLTSGDGGKTWGNKVTVGERQSSWPGLLDLGVAGGGARFLYLLEKGGQGVRSQLMTLM